jgi:drug/metabolite transporter (DMT)-like permease
VRAALRRPDAVVLVVLATVVGPVLGVSLFLLSLQYIPTGKSQTIVAIVPVLILPFVVVFYRERVSWRAAVGACVTVAGIALLFTKG